MSADDPNEEEVRALYSRIKKLEAELVNQPGYISYGKLQYIAGLEAAAKVAKEAEFLDCVIDKQLATAELILKLKED